VARMNTSRTSRNFLIACLMTALLTLVPLAAAQDTLAADARGQLEARAAIAADVDAQSYVDAAADAAETTTAQLRAEAEARAEASADVAAHTTARAEARAHAEAESRVAATVAAVGALKTEAQARAEASVEVASQTFVTLRGEAEARLDAAQETSAQVAADVGAGLRANFVLVRDWFTGLFGAAQVQADSTYQAAHDEAWTIENGHLSADASADLAITADAAASAAAVTPPQPDVGFFAGVSAALKAFVGLD